MKYDISIKLVRGMEEPAKKKFKADVDDICNKLEVLQQHLLQNCLCCASENTLKTIFCSFQMTDMSDITFHLGRDSILMLSSSIQLICDIALKQNSSHFICSKIADVCNALIENESHVIDRLIKFSTHEDQFICFSASRALSSLFIIAKSHIDQRWLDKLVENIVSSDYQCKMSFSLDVIKRIIEWKDIEEHILEDNISSSSSSSAVKMCVAPSCHRIHLTEIDDHFDTMQVKCFCIKSLQCKWFAIVKRFDMLISTHSTALTYQAEIVTFLDLWRAIISVKANLSVIDTKPFYSDVNSFVSLLSSEVPPVIWKRMLDLFNEVLCYGSTLALQDVLAEEPCSLATLLIRNVKDTRLLDTVPYREGNGRFGGGSGDNDKPLLQKMVLLILKAVAIMVKETRCDSSSDSSLGSEAADVDADMAVIERSIREVFRQLDSCIKALLPFHPETVLAQWVVQLFSDQDDALVESMVCCLDITIGLCYNRNTALPDLREILNPGVTFVQFLRTVSFNYEVLLDFLVSNETCFLLYLLRLLKYVCRNWNDFVMSCGRHIGDTMTVLIRLRISINRLVSKNLFPYNVNPVIRLLTKCEDLYDKNLKCCNITPT